MSETMEFEQMLGILRRGKINLKAFNKGPKSLKELYDEIRKGEATLRYDEEMGRVVREARSAKIIIESSGFELCETARLYERSNREVLHEEPQPGASETALPADFVETPFGCTWSPLLTGIRCLKQEWGVLPDRDFIVQPFFGSWELDRTHTKGFLGTLWYDHLTYGQSLASLRYRPSDQTYFEPLEHPKLEHESKAYLDVFSIVETAYLRLNMPHKRWDNGRRLKDGNVRLLLKWLPSAVHVDLPAADRPR